MEDIKYQIFVSSTYTDLSQARKKVIDTILSLYHFPVGMEMFSADDNEQWEVIQETINASDYYVIIIGHRYGSLSDNEISFTEREYDYAKSLQIPILAFIQSRDIPTNASQRESNPILIQKLNDFIVKAQASKMCSFWTNEDELAKEVAIALPKFIKKAPRVGWIRGDKAALKEISKELAILSSENRTLREKVIEYEAKLIKSKPELEFSIFDGESITIYYEVVKSNVTRPHELDYSVITTDLSEFLTKEDIDKYNKEIPSEEEVKYHNEKFVRYTNLTNNSLTITPQLTNNGSKAANDIHITIDFPDFIEVVTHYDKERLLEPDIYIPHSPLEIAKQELKFSNSPIGAMGAAFFKSETMRSLSRSNALLGNLLPNFQPVNTTEWGSVDDDNLTLKSKKLLHTRKVVFNNITLLPLSVGYGNINIRVICEELEEEIVIAKEIKVLPKH
ncbi:TPA: DUF4062 domain-containing protein [Yersinia enterocolitica]|nr:DUF4062 domain-containing protein [Yersinia enterocolitica]